VEVGDQALLVGHAGERRSGVARVEFVKQRSRTARGASDLPERVSSMEGDFTARIAELPNCRIAELM
jgi:hypothetical protein